jgi:putative transposase
MPTLAPVRYFKTSPEITRLMVMLYGWFLLSLRNAKDFLHERAIEISHETVRLCWNRFGPMSAAEVRRRRVDRMRPCRQLRCRIHEMFLKINGEMH